jgi:hypothetical protein
MIEEKISNRYEGRKRKASPKTVIALGFDLCHPPLLSPLQPCQPVVFSLLASAKLFPDSLIISA